MTTLDHVAESDEENLKGTWMGCLPYSLYSPDVAPSDYHLFFFRSMQHGLSEQHFSYFENIKKSLDDWIVFVPKSLFQMYSRG